MQVYKLWKIWRDWSNAEKTEPEEILWYLIKIRIGVLHSPTKADLHRYIFVQFEIEGA